MPLFPRVNPIKLLYKLSTVRLSVPSHALISWVLPWEMCRPETGLEERHGAGMAGGPCNPDVHSACSSPNGTWARRTVCRSTLPVSTKLNKTPGLIRGCLFTGMHEGGFTVYDDWAAGGATVKYHAQPLREQGEPGRNCCVRVVTEQ